MFLLKFVLMVMLLTLGLASIVQNYFLLTSWGVNALYLKAFVEALFSEFSPCHSIDCLQLTSNYEILHSIAKIRQEALQTLEIYLLSWSTDAHLTVPYARYLLNMYNRVKLCLVFLTFSTFTDWLDVVFIKLQPLTPLSWLYEVRFGYLYGADMLDYRTFIRRGAVLFFKLMIEGPLNLEESNQLAEFLISLASELSVLAEGERINSLLAGIEVTKVTPEQLAAELKVSGYELVQSLSPSS